MKNLILLLLIVSNSSFTFSQTLPLPNIKLLSKWERVFLKNVGNIDIPSTMEVQKGKYKQRVNQYREKYYEKINFGTPDIIIQQKGLGEFKKESFNKYARVIIETIIETPGEFENLNFNISTITQTEINELNYTTKQQVQQGLLMVGSKLIKWYPIKIEKVNGMSCIHSSYKRQFKNEPYVLVHTYSFMNDDRIHILALSYRYIEQEFWKSDFVTILKSFRITNIK